MRRKAEAVEAPQSREEASAIAGRYAEIAQQQASILANFDGQIATLVAQRDAMLARYDVEAEGLFERLRAWWAVAGKAGAKGKSTALGGVRLGERITTPKLGYQAGLDEAKALKRLLSLRWPLRERFVRRTAVLNKQAILNALVYSKSGAVKLRGLFAVLQKDEFFISVETAEEVDESCRTPLGAAAAIQSATSCPTTPYVGPPITWTPAWATSKFQDPFANPVCVSVEDLK